MSVSGSLGISFTKESLQVKVLWGSEEKEQNNQSCPEESSVGT